MNNTTRLWMAIGAVGLFIASVAPVDAQSTLGGAKTQQNKIGGVAKPAAVIGGATIRTPSPPTPPKPGAVVNIAKPGSPGLGTPNTTANTAALGQAPGPRPNPPVTPPNKGGAVAASNVRCSSDTCGPKGQKP
jgi:hypothetical protein